MTLFLCIAGVCLLTAAPVLCWLRHDTPLLWAGALIAGEIIAWSGVLPILSKLF